MRQQALENSRAYMSAALKKHAPGGLAEKRVKPHSPLFKNVPYRVTIRFLLHYTLLFKIKYQGTTC